MSIRVPILSRRGPFEGPACEGSQLLFFYTCHWDHHGFFLCFSRAVGDVNGFALAQQDMGVGARHVNSYILGVGWTHIRAGGWYTDAVVMGSALTVCTYSNDNVSGSTDGNAFTGAVEAGLAVALDCGLTREPQVQLLWHWLSLGKFSDGVSDHTRISDDTLLSWIGSLAAIGVRCERCELEAVSAGERAVLVRR